MRTRLPKARVLIALLLAAQFLFTFATQATQAATESQSQYSVALPGYRYEFPRDHFDHPDYQTEWWYYTGNVTSTDGHRFGFELTFFSQGANRDASRAGAWD